MAGAMGAMYDTIRYDTIEEFNVDSKAKSVPWDRNSLWTMDVEKPGGRRSTPPIPRHFTPCWKWIVQL